MGLKLVGEVALDGSGFERGLARLGSGAVGGFKNLLVSAFGIYGIEQAIAKTVDRAGELVDTSKRLGVGVEQLQVLQQAAKDSSTDLGQVTRAFEKIDVAREKALSGSKEGMKLLARFSQLGISREDLQNQTAANLFMGPMASRARSMNQEDIGPILRDVLGKGAGELLSMLQEDFGGLEQKMRKLGAIMSAETAVKLDKLGDEFSLLSQIITSQLGPALLAFAEGAYRALLKLGGGVAGLSATAGAGTAKMGFWEAGLAYFKAAGYGLNAMAARAIGASEEQTTAWLKSKMAGAGFDVEAMKTASAGATEPWIKKLDEFEANLAELTKAAADLNRPTSPKFEVADESEPKKVKQSKERGDALLRVGNFLGSGRSVIEDIANRQLVVLREIAANTRPSMVVSDTTDYPPD